MEAAVEKFSRYRDIILYRTLAGIKSESRQNYLGYLWYVLEPLLTTVIFYLAFAKLMGRGGREYVMFLLIGLISWQWFESSCLQAAGAIKAKLHILQHFDLPKFLFPLVTILTNSWKFLCIYLVSIGTAIFLGFAPGLNYFYLPLILGCELLLIISLSLPLAIAATYFNDTLTLAAAIFRILFFVSGIYFDADKVPLSLRTAFYANPMAGLIESYRHVLLAHTQPNLSALAYSALLSAGLLGPGLMLCHYVDRRILKHVSL